MGAHDEGSSKFCLEVNRYQTKFSEVISDSWIQVPINATLHINNQDNLLTWWEGHAHVNPLDGGARGRHTWEQSAAEQGASSPASMETG